MPQMMPINWIFLFLFFIIIFIMFNIFYYYIFKYKNINNIMLYNLTKKSFFNWKW